MAMAQRTVVDDEEESDDDESVGDALSPLTYNSELSAADRDRYVFQVRVGMRPEQGDLLDFTSVCWVLSGDIPTLREAKREFDLCHEEHKVITRTPFWSEDDWEIFFGDRNPVPEYPLSFILSQITIPECLEHTLAQLHRRWAYMPEGEEPI